MINLPFSVRVAEGLKNTLKVGDLFLSITESGERSWARLHNLKERQTAWVVADGNAWGKFPYSLKSYNILKG